MSDPLISVVLSIYNVAAYIEKCILSLLAQTYKNIELILVDDCSPDNSVDLAVSLLKKHQFTNYQLIRHRINGGAAVGRNTGLEAAKGEYLYFIDNDDFAEPTILAELITPFFTEEVDIIICDFWRYYSKTGKREVGFHSPFQGKVVPSVAIKMLFAEKEHAYVWRCLYKRKNFDTIRFAEGVPVEDMMTTPLLWANANGLYFIPRLLYNYVQRPGSVMVSWKNVERWYNVTKFMVRNEQYFKTHTTLKPLYNDIVVYHYTMLRNYSLTMCQGERGFEYYKPLLNQYGTHLKVSALIHLFIHKQMKLSAQLTVLKVSSLLFWKRFRIEN